MAAAEEPPAPVDTAPLSRRERARRRTAALRLRAQHLAERAQEERHHNSVDTVFEFVDRDLEVGGGIIAGALAYRLFIWLLPFALVVVAGLGVAADRASESPERAAKSLGLAGLVSNSVSNAAESSARWYALLIGIPVLLYATRSVLRVLIGSHRLVWGDVRARAPKPTMSAVGRFFFLIVCLYLASGVASAVRADSLGIGVVTTVLLLVPYAGIWLLVSMQLPHRAARWTDLIPGAVLFAVGIELLNVVAAYFIAPYAIAKQGTYGALGVAAALLLGLFMISRLVVGAAMLNATLWERKVRARPPAAG